MAADNKPVGKKPLSGKTDEHLAPDATECWHANAKHLLASLPPQKHILRNNLFMGRFLSSFQHLIPSSLKDSLSSDSGFSFYCYPICALCLSFI